MVSYGSVCSGIESAAVALLPLGFEPVWLSEIAPFPCAVLAHHYPNIPNLGDMTQIAVQVLSGKVVAPAVLIGGTPCQAFSVAGMREGLNDPRGLLTINYVGLADAVDLIRTRRGEPETVLIWENVAGVLQDTENAFGCFLGALVGEVDELKPTGAKWSDAGCVYGPARAVAWRVLDAQYFGVAQRRRRVFVVASARTGLDPAAILFEFDSLRRDITPRRNTGPAIASEFGIGVDLRNGQLTGDVAHTLQAGEKGVAPGNTPHLLIGGKVRRPTPRECERLQGLPDDYTLIPWRGKPAEACPDTQRYRAIGNCKAVPVVHWLGRRLAATLEA